MPHSARAVANYFLDRAWQAGGSLNAIKLQKLVYFAHGWHLAIAEQPLLDEVVFRRSLAFGLGKDCGCGFQPQQDWGKMPQPQNRPTRKFSCHKARE